MSPVIRSIRIKKGPSSTKRPTMEIGASVQLISGALAGLSGEVVRVEKENMCLVAIPNSKSGLLVRVPRQRFRRLNNCADN